MNASPKAAHSKNRRLQSLRELLLAHASGYVLLVAATGIIGGAGFYYWKQASEESLRTNSLVEEVQAMRGALYRQMKEVFDAVLLGDKDAATQYSEYGQRVQTHLRALREMAAGPDELQAIGRLASSYNAVRLHTDDIIRDWKTYDPGQRQRVLDSELETGSLRNYEQAFAEIESLLAQQQSRLQTRLRLLSRLSLLVLGTPFLAAVALLLWSRHMLNRAVVAPILDVQKAATMISQGNLEHRVPEQGARELVELSQSINQMALDLSESRKSLVKAEKQATLAALVPVVAHNIRNPLASIRATAQVVADPGLPADVRDGLEGIIRATDRLDGWTASLLSYLHPLQPQRVAGDARELVDQVLLLLESKLRSRSLSLERRGWGVPAQCLLDPRLVEQGLQGLITNAVDASPECGTIAIEVRTDDENLYICIEDQGPGMPLAPSAGTLSPGPSTKRSGTGLGIPFAMKVCEVHEGALSFENRVDSGTRVIMRIPFHAGNDRND